MNGTRTMLGLVLASALLPLAAQEYDLKVRVGLNAGSIVQDLRDNKALGLAAQATFPLGASSALTAELGYDYMPGRGKDRIPERAGQTLYAQTPGGVVTTGPNGKPLQVLIDRNLGSRDIARRSFEGFSLRGAYRAALPVFEGLAWQAGLSLDAYRSDNEFGGATRPVYVGNDGKLATIGGESWVENHERKAFTVGAFAGLVYQLHPNHKLEFNVRNIGYGLKDFKPFTYTGRKGEVVDANGRGWVFECALSVKL